jgi:hypothetical protein
VIRLLEGVRYDVRVLSNEVKRQGELLAEVQGGSYQTDAQAQGPTFAVKFPITADEQLDKLEDDLSDAATESNLVC